MNNALLVSSVLLWIIVLVMAVVIFALVRQPASTPRRP